MICKKRPTTSLAIQRGSFMWAHTWICGISNITGHGPHVEGYVCALIGVVMGLVGVLSLQRLLQVRTDATSCYGWYVSSLRQLHARPLQDSLPQCNSVTTHFGNIYACEKNKNWLRYGRLAGRIEDIFTFSRMRIYFRKVWLHCYISIMRPVPMRDSCSVTAIHMIGNNW
jgi:hypothetical protein